MSLRLAHLSDLHFTSSHLNYCDFFSKSWIANLNWRFFRHRHYGYSHLGKLPSQLKEDGIDFVAFTGDVSTSSRFEELMSGHAFLKGLNLPYLSIPGNHDCYTYTAYKKRFYYRIFSNPALEKEGVELCHLKDNWWAISLDCTLATPPFCAYGYFSIALQQRLNRLLDMLAKNTHVIILCHFPLYAYKGGRHELWRRKELLELLLRYPQIKLYLHGHDHTFRIEKFRSLTSLCAGSLTKKSNSAYSLIECDANGSVKTEIKQM